MLPIRRGIGEREILSTDGRCHGTKNCGRQAIEAEIPTYLIDSEKAVPKRLLADDPRLE